MDSGLYAAYTGLLARTQALDTAANNLANAGTNGFRAQRETFRAVIANGLAAGVSGSQVGETVNSYGVLGGSRVDLSQGALASTGNPLDLGIDGAGFFAVQTKQGIRYTRDGSFTQSAVGQLQTSAGEAVLDTAGQPIVVPSGPVQISADGTVSVGSGVVARVGVFGFPAGTLTAEGANRFVASGVPSAAEGAIRQGTVEGANQDAVHGSMEMILVQRQAEMMQKALGVFDGSFDKTAVEEIARV